MVKKGRRVSKSLGKKTQKMMKSSCMWGGDSAPYSGSGSGATGYGEAIYGPANAQTTNGMGSNNIKMADPAVVWKGGQRGGGDPVTVIIANGNLTYTLPTTPSTDPTQPTQPAQTVTVNLEPNSSLTYTAGQSGGSMLGAAIVPAALLAANQLYKPTRAINNLSFGRKKGFKKTLKKFPRRKR
jgi:hypothetical protein